MGKLVGQIKSGISSGIGSSLVANKNTETNPLATIFGNSLKTGSDLAAAKSAKDIGKRNSEISKEDAKLAFDEARENSIRELRLTRQRISSGIVRASAGGVVAGVGTPLLVALDEAKKGKERAENILAEGANKEARLQSQAGAELLEGKTVSRARTISAASTVLGSITKAKGKKRGFEKTIE